MSKLINALVGDRTELYWTSATFHNSIDVLASMLPAWVDGLASYAVGEDVRRAARLEVLLNGPLLSDDLSLGLVGDGPNSSRSDSGSNSDADPLAGSDAVRQGEGER
jgi:hypothetical protein